MTERRLEDYARQLALVADSGDQRLEEAARSALRVDAALHVARQLGERERARLVERILQEMGGP